MNLIPRNDYVLIRRVALGQTPSGVHVPESALEGVEHLVVALGPKVVDLQVGDKVLMLGTKGQDYGFLPNAQDLILIKEQNVVLIYGAEA